MQNIVKIEASDSLLCDFSLRNYNNFKYRQFFETVWKMFTYV